MTPPCICRIVQGRFLLGSTGNAWDAKDGHCDGASDVSEVHDARSLEVYTRVVIARRHVVGLVVVVVVVVGCAVVVLARRATIEVTFSMNIIMHLFGAIDRFFGFARTRRICRYRRSSRLGSLLGDERMFEVVSCSWTSSPEERSIHMYGKHVWCYVEGHIFSYAVSRNRKPIHWLLPGEALSGREGTRGCNSTCNYGWSSLLICSICSGWHWSFGCLRYFLFTSCWHSNAQLARLALPVCSISSRILDGQPIILCTCPKDAFFNMPGRYSKIVQEDGMQWASRAHTHTTFDKASWFEIPGSLFRY